MTCLLTFLRKYRKYLIPAATLALALFCWVVIRRMTFSDAPAATSGWLYWGAGAYLVFLGCCLENRHVRFGLAALGILLLYPGLFCRNHYDGFVYAWLGLITLNLLGIFYFRGRKTVFVILCNMLPVLIFLAGAVFWFNLDYFGRTSKASEFTCKRSDELGYVHVENKKIQISLYHFWKKILSAPMTLDPLGRRITPANPPGREIIFIGCSFTEGALLADEDTLPWRVGKLSGRRVLNLGVSGYGIHQFQKMLEQEVLWDRLTPGCHPEKIIYLGMTGHVPRIVNSGCPAYTLKNGRSVPAVRDDPTTSSFIGMLGSKLRQNFLGILLIARLSENKYRPQDIELYTSSIRQCAEMLKKKYPAAEFMVLYHDSVHDAATGQILDKLKQDGIRVVLVSSLVKGKLSDQKYKIPYDGHPSALCWQEAAPEFCRKYLSCPAPGNK